MRKPRSISRRALRLYYTQKHLQSTVVRQGFVTIASSILRWLGPKIILRIKRSATRRIKLPPVCFGLRRTIDFWMEINESRFFLSVGLFLQPNGYELVASPLHAVQVFRSLAAGKLAGIEHTSWIANSTLNR